MPSIADVEPTAQPQTFLGHEVNPHVVPGKPELGFFGSIAPAAEIAWWHVVDRWSGLASLISDGQKLSYGQWKDIVGDRPLTYEEGITKGEAQRQVQIYEARQYQNQFDTNVLSSFVTPFVISTLDPVNLATLPFGGAYFRAAHRAETFGQRMRLASRGGAQAGLASVPVEVGVQLASKGEVDPGQVAMSAIAPAVLSPVMFLPGSLMRSLRGQTAESVQAAAESPVRRPDADPEEMAASMDDAPAPPHYERTTTRQVTPDLLNRHFADYQGGARQWFRDLAYGVASAESKARDLGLDPDSGAFKRTVQEVGEYTDLRITRDVEYNQRLLTKLASRERDPVLNQEGMTDELGNALPGFKRLQGIVRKPIDQRTVDDIQFMSRFEQNGPGWVRQREIYQLNQKIDQALEQTQQTHRAVLQATKSTKQARDLKKQLGQERHVARSYLRQKDELVNTNRYIDDSLSDEHLVGLLESMVDDRATPPTPDTAGWDDFVPNEPITEQSQGYSYEGAAELADIAMWARSKLDDSSEVDKTIEDLQNILNDIERCGNG